jgi:hypothetical protein
MGEGSPVTVDPAEARKRRKAILTSQRQETEAGTAAAENVALAAAAVAAPPKPVTNAAPRKKQQKTTSSSSLDPPTTKKQKNDENDDDDDASNASSSNDKRKTQIRYDPEEPMSKEQLAAWRREARRVRNRESAAASRQRIRSRITELETEVDGWKTKYNDAVGRMRELEQVAASQAVEAAPVKLDTSSETEQPKV